MDRSAAKVRIAIALLVALFSVISYYRSTSYNEVTGEKQHISLTPEQDVAMGLQAAPQMAQEFGGLYPDERLQAHVKSVGQRLVIRSRANQSPFNQHFNFHLLADNRTVNAFALPGGQIFITAALYERLENEAQLAGVLGHEIAHVIARHGAQQMAKSDLTNGLIGAVGVASGTAEGAQMAAAVGQMINMKYGRDDELESDYLGVDFMSDAGYDPTAMIRVMEILREASGGASRVPEFQSTHPDPENRIGQIKAAIHKKYPNGVPSNLEE